MVERKGNLPNRPYRQLVSTPADIEITSVPPLKNDAYRVWTAEHGLDWRHKVHGATGMSSWALVGVDGWHVNSCGLAWNEQRGGWDQLPGDQVQLAVFRKHPDRSERHPELDKTRYACPDDANDAAWDAGLLGLMIYDVAARQHPALAVAIDSAQA